MRKGLIIDAAWVGLAVVFISRALAVPVPSELAGTYWLMAMFCVCEIVRRALESQVEAMQKRLRAKDQELIDRLYQTIEMHNELGALDADRIAELEAMLPEVKS